VLVPLVLLRVLRLRMLLRRVLLPVLVFGHVVTFPFLVLPGSRCLDRASNGYLNMTFSRQVRLSNNV
jgi:hypothetical protein